MTNKNGSLIIFGIIVLSVILYSTGALSNLGLFSIYFPVGGVGDLGVQYQSMSVGCVVRLQKGSSTTWVGVYDVATQGKKNADITKSIGWVSDSNYPLLVTLLKDNPPPLGCIKECSSGQTKCEGTNYYTCSNNNWINQEQVDGQCGFQEEIETVTRTQLGIFINQYINGDLDRIILGQKIQMWII